MDEQGAGRAAPVVEDNPLRVAAERAADVLGWPGVVLPEVGVLGCRLLPVVVVDAAVHEMRRHDGDGPELDTDVLAIWEWPETPGPAPALRLTGGLFRTHRRFADVLSQAREWRPFGSSAVLASASAAADQVNRWECALHGIGLVAAEPEVEHVPAEVGRRAPARRRTADRWIEEILYAHALDVGGIFAQPEA